MKKIQFDQYHQLANCASEPIQFIGAIQSFGALIVLSLDDYRPAFVSENISDFFDISHERVLAMSGMEVMGLFQPQLSVDFIEKNPINSSYHYQWVNVHEIKYTLVLHRQDNYLFLELLPAEPMDVNETGLPNQHSKLYDYLFQLTQKANSSENLQDYCNIFCQLFRELVGYDRVMVYRFDEDFNGEVFGESAKENLTAYFGLHYPSTDIPEQARELYKKVHLRIIENVEASPVPVFTNTDNASHMSLDLGRSILRSSSPIHLEYLKNMGVSATLTVSIMINNRLWGLVACHHYSSRYASISERETALALTNVLSTQLHHWQRSADYAAVQEKEHIYQMLLTQGVKGKDIFHELTQASYITALTDSTGVAIVRDKKIFTYGLVPEDQVICQLHDWMISKVERVFQCTELSRYYPQMISHADVVSGVLYYELDAESRSAIFWFRPQLSEGKKWGGNPDLDKEVTGLLTPRRSFEAWQQEVHGKSAKWKSHEIQAGLRLGAYLEREIFIKNLNYQKERYKKLTNELQQANEELRQFNWISSHDMKEPLRKIRLFIDQIKLEGEELGASNQLYFERIDHAAARMQQLIDDLLNYADLSREQKLEYCSLKSIIEEVAEELELNAAALQLSDLPSVDVVPFQIRQLFCNLISNSIKFQQPGRALRIAVTTALLTSEDHERIFPDAPESYIKLVYQDNGIGFSSEYNEQVFELFQRLHGQNEYSGTGIGLAICKKIAEAHHGFIRAYGEEGEGVRFEVVLKANEPILKSDH
jgi:light-regulated signal transduction histidine kinase (bacteriophytochrome)